MSESYEEAQQRVSNQRAENLMEAHERIKELEQENAELKRIIADSRQYALGVADERERAMRVCFTHSIHSEDLANICAEAIRKGE